MENYIVSARKYRPATFSTVVGQKALTATLKNAIATDRLAHAYLFCGSRGVGKTSCARIFAKTINCSNPTADGDPCNECDSCRAFNENRSLNIIELDAASNNGVEDIRALVEQVQVPPTSGRFRVFIIDEVHMLSTAAFNAFLKTLEEPPSYVIFILATTEKQKIIPTILSRCQIYDFNRITVTDMVDHLEYVAKQEGFTAERSALAMIASKADGAMRDALSIFDQVAASSRGNITYASTIENLNILDSAYYSRLVESFLKGDVPEALLIYKEIRDRGFDSHFFVTGLAAYLRDLMVARDDRTISLLDTDQSVRQQMAELARRCPVDFFYAAMSLCNEADLNYRAAYSKRFLVELLLIRLCQQLSPSRTCSGNGEGQLQPIAANAPAGGGISSAAQQPAADNVPCGTSPQAIQEAAQPAAPVTPGRYTPPPPPPVSMPPARPGKILRHTHLRQAETAKTATSTAAAATQRTEPRNAPFTTEQILQAWDSFAAGRQNEHILVNTIRSCRPRPTSGSTFDIMVENPGQVEMLKGLMPQLLSHLRDAVGNDSVNLTLSINNAGPAPKIWNDREILQHLLTVSPTLAKMMEDLRLKLM